MSSNTRPNVLLLMGDEHPVSMTGCYGHRSVQSPTLDALAEGGTVFDAAYCASPISAPSRAAMMTTRHVSTIEVWDNSSPLRSDWPTFAHSFRAAGYRTALCGKMHFVGPDQLHGFEERWTQDVYPATFDWTKSNRKEPCVNPGQNIDRVYQAGPGWSRDMDYDEEVAFRAEYGLRRMNWQDDKRPFFLCVSFTGPHYPFQAPKAYWERYSDDDVDLPEIPENYLELEHEYAKWLRRHGKFDHLVPDDKCRAARRSVLARITMLDDYLKRVLTALKELGLENDTIIAYVSDHGDMMGERGLWFKNAPYEWSSRVPLILQGPGVPAGRIGEPVSLLDLGPTLGGLAGVNPVYEVSDGHDHSDLARGERPSGEGQAIMENYGEGTWRGTRMIRRGAYKLNFIPGYEPELFNLEQDPGEWKDLAQDPASAEVKADLLQRVLEGWDPEACDERRYQSEERRLAILKALEGGPSLGWTAPSAPVPHPLNFV